MKNGKWFKFAKKTQPELTKMIYEQGGCSLKEAKEMGKTMALVGAGYGSAWEKITTRNEALKREAKRLARGKI